MENSIGKLFSHFPPPSSSSVVPTLLFAPSSRPPRGRGGGGLESLGFCITTRLPVPPGGPPPGGRGGGPGFGGDVEAPSLVVVVRRGRGGGPGTVLPGDGRGGGPGTAVPGDGRGGGPGTAVPGEGLGPGPAPGGFTTYADALFFAVDSLIAGTPTVFPGTTPRRMLPISCFAFPDFAAVVFFFFFSLCSSSSRLGCIVVFLALSSWALSTQPKTSTFHSSGL